jgi:chitosanase
VTDIQKKTAQAIVNIFETGHVHGEYGQVTLLAGDPGHLTYGRSQTTLASGNLYLLIQAYCDSPDASAAAALTPYLERLSNRDLTLDHDFTFRGILREAGRDSVMHETQDLFFDRVYWTPASLSAKNAGVHSGLGTAVVYDSVIHGSWRLIRDRANAAGSAAEIGEKRWVAAYVAARHEWLATHSITLLRKCVYRTTALSQLIRQEKWDLELPLTIRGIELTEDLLASPPVRVSAESESRRVLKLASPFMVGDDVRAVQVALGAHGFAGAVDGIYGPLTEARVRQFQLKKGLKADGFAGPATLASLGVD